MHEISKTILIEDLVNDYPASVSFLMEQGIKCLRCGEPIWGTLESNAREKGFSDSEIDDLTVKLKQLLKGSE